MSQVGQVRTFRQFDGKLKGHPDTPDEALVAGTIQKVTAQAREIAGVLAGHDNGSSDTHPKKGIVATTLPVLQQNGNIKDLPIYRTSTVNGWNQATQRKVGDAGAVLELHPNHQPKSLQIADKERRVVIKATFDETGAVDTFHSVQKGSGVDAAREGKLTKASDGTKRLTVDTFELVRE